MAYGLKACSCLPLSGHYTDEERYDPQETLWKGYGYGAPNR